MVLFAGYAFAKEYLKARGHWCAVKDVTKTARLSPATPATCWTCKSPEVPKTMLALGDKDEEQAAAAADEPGRLLRHEVRRLQGRREEFTHPIGCLDCHDPRHEAAHHAARRCARPSAAGPRHRQHPAPGDAHAGLRPVPRRVLLQEPDGREEGQLPDLPLGQGHDAGEDRGVLRLDSAACRHEQKFSDWTHAISKAPMIKMQHPDYEVYATGVHAYRNVACADCHMPYRTEGGVKFTDHHLQSPLLNIANSCAVCHRWSEAEIRTRVEGIQDKVREARARGREGAGQAHFDIAAAMQAGASDEELAGVRQAGPLRADALGLRGGQQRHGLPLAAGVHARAGRGHRPGRRVPRRVCPHPRRQRLLRAGRLSRLQHKEKAQALIKQFVDGKPPKLLPKKKP